jgi:hypothetical protein
VAAKRPDPRGGGGWVDGRTCRKPKKKDRNQPRDRDRRTCVDNANDPRIHGIRCEGAPFAWTGSYPSSLCSAADTSSNFPCPWSEMRSDAFHVGDRRGWGCAVRPDGSRVWSLMCRPPNFTRDDNRHTVVVRFAPPVSAANPLASRFVTARCCALVRRIRHCDAIIRAEDWQIHRHIHSDLWRKSNPSWFCKPKQGNEWFGVTRITVQFLSLLSPKFTRIVRRVIRK